jgi:hypothetical protein
MTEAEWLVCEDAKELCNSLRTELDVGRAKAGQRKLWLFGCASCRLVWEALPDQRSRAAVEYAEGLADGTADPTRLREVYDDAYKAANERTVRRASRKLEAALAVCGLVARGTPESATQAHTAMRRHMYNPADKYYRRWRGELRQLAHLLRDIFGNPFRPVTFHPEWRTSTVVALANQMYESRDFSAMPILADALQDAGCDNEDILNHCRDPKATHVRGCWVVDLVLGKT